MKYNKRFSIGHFDRLNDDQYSDTYYHMMKNADQSFLDNIHDIYFGKYFYYFVNSQIRKDKAKCKDGFKVIFVSSAMIAFEPVFQ